MNSILVVDNTPLCRELMAAVLRSKRFQVRTATNGRDALVIIGEQIPDLILMDIDLPELDGLAVMRVLRSNPQYKDIPCIVLTAVAERDSVLESRRLGANDYILKSHFSLEDLMTRITRVLTNVPAPCTT